MSEMQATSDGVLEGCVGGRGTFLHNNNRYSPLALVSNESSNYVAETTGCGLPVLFYIGIASLANRRCGSLAAKQNNTRTIIRCAEIRSSSR